jgi:SAM-dependent methyltransferase
MLDDTKRPGGLSPELRRSLETVESKGLMPGVAGTEGSLSSETANTAAIADQTKNEFRALYNEISKQLDSTQFGPFAFFLNLGYVADGSLEYAPIELPTKYINHNAAKLVLEVIGDCDLNGRRILDVGCGRGGTIHVINEFFQPAATTGVDLSPIAIESCRKTHKYESAVFEEADAESLPFGECTFDVVTNIESSHSYPNLNMFYAEVFRVLAPGGYFLYADLLTAEKFRHTVDFVSSLGFEVERDRDITGNVLGSCDRTASSNARAFKSGTDITSIANFLSLPGSQVYEGMKNRTAVYRVLKLRKPQ